MSKRKREPFKMKFDIGTIKHPTFRDRLRAIFEQLTP